MTLHNRTERPSSIFHTTLSPASLSSLFPSTGLHRSNAIRGGAPRLQRSLTIDVASPRLERSNAVAIRGKNGSAIRARIHAGTNRSDPSSLFPESELEFCGYGSGFVEVVHQGSREDEKEEGSDIDAFVPLAPRRSRTITSFGHRRRGRIFDALPHVRGVPISGSHSGSGVCGVSWMMSTDTADRFSSSGRHENHNRYHNQGHEDEFDEPDDDYDYLNEEDDICTSPLTYEHPYRSGPPMICPVPRRIRWPFFAARGDLEALLRGHDGAIEEEVPELVRFGDVFVRSSPARVPRVVRSEEVPGFMLSNRSFDRQGMHLFAIHEGDLVV